MDAHLPLPLAMDFETGRIDGQMQRTAAGSARKLRHDQRGRAPAKRGIVRDRDRQSQQRLEA